MRPSIHRAVDQILLLTQSMGWKRKQTGMKIGVPKELWQGKQPQ